MARPKLIVILGTTACGKSGLGVELARRFDGEIVSADSRQVYRGLDLGTGKITPEEMQGVPHHLLDVVEPGQPYSVAQFQQDAYAAIDGILARGHLPFLVGGTGLYLRAVTEGFTFSDAQPDPGLRAELEGKSSQELYGIWQSHTGRTLNQSERQNHQRLVRLVEKALSGGGMEAPSDPRYSCLLLGVNYPREEVCRRIDRRLLARLDAGMVEEVANLRAQGVGDEFLERLGLEYRYILWYLTGRLESREALMQALGQAIKRFAKRQVVWFKRDEGVYWLDMEHDPQEQAVKAIQEFLSPGHQDMEGQC